MLNYFIKSILHAKTTLSIYFFLKLSFKHTTAFHFVGSVYSKDFTYSEYTFNVLRKLQFYNDNGY